MAAHSSNSWAVKSAGVICELSHIDGLFDTILQSNTQHNPVLKWNYSQQYQQQLVLHNNDNIEHQSSSHLFIEPIDGSPTLYKP